MQPEQGVSNHLHAQLLLRVGVRGPGTFWGLGKVGSLFFSIFALITPESTVLAIEMFRKCSEFSLLPSAS